MLFISTTSISTFTYRAIECEYLEYLCVTIKLLPLLTAWVFVAFAHTDCTRTRDNNIDYACRNIMIIVIRLY